MNWHARYVQQANWTRELRAYLFDKSGLAHARNVLEVGCGTGAILADIHASASLHGLDLDPVALAQCRVHAPAALLTRGDAFSLPFPDEYFEIVFCHFFLLWVKDPLQAITEMKRVTRQGENILALAEPDYSARVDKPDELATLGQWQAESLRRQGADPSFGARLAETFHQAGIRLVETGPIQGPEKRRSDEEWKQEWEVLESDLAGIASAEEIHKMKVLDAAARAQDKRILHVPTYFARGKA